MSGHSKWSTIKRAKGAADAKRGATFTKLGNAITIAAKLGNSGDPASNPKLRMAIEAARAVNMPKENVQRAIDRGLGNLPGQVIEEILFEGFGPGKVGFIIEGVTDSKNRTLSEIKNFFEKNGGSLGSSGSVAFMFDRVGEIKVKSKGGSSEDEILELIDLGADDVEEYEDEGLKYLVYVDTTSLFKVGTAISDAGFEVESQELVYKPNTLTDVADKEKADKVLNFYSTLEDRDDVQKVFANFNIPDDLIS